MPAETTARRGPGHTIRKFLFRAFYRMPGAWRRGVVRLIQPRYVVGAVTLVRTSDAGTDRLLLLRQPSSSNGWSLPGGLMDRGERPVECAARELREETGITVDLEHLVPATPNALIHYRGQWVDCVFETRVPANTAVTVDGAEVYEATFHPVDALPPLTVPTARLLGHYGIGPYVDYPETRDL